MGEGDAKHREAESRSTLTNIRITLAVGDYDRTRALGDGRVRPEGVDLTVLNLPVEEIFYRQLTYREFDLSEMSFSSYVLSLQRPDPAFIAIPVFPSRYFRHQSVFINRKSGIESPSDLRGKRIGTPEYQMTAAVWQRGFLEDDFGVAVEDYEVFTGGIEAPGRHEKIPLPTPDTIRITPIGPDQTLSQMLADGEIDAIASASTPSSFRTSPDVVRLFPDFEAVEQDYYRRTAIFPIMHVIVIRREVYAAYPWLARTMMKAFAEALDIARDDLQYRSALRIMLPWLTANVEEAIELMGPKYFEYGIEPNRHVIDAFLRYHRRQGLSTRELEAEDLFVPNAGSAFVI